MIGRIAVCVLLAVGANGIARAIEAPAASTLCVTCHGVQGEGNQALGAPRIAGQDAAYLARQLANFRAGRRGYDPEDKAGTTMRSVAAGISDGDVQALATYYSRLSISASATRTASQGDLNAGEQLYAGTCASCHGWQAQGLPPLQAPSLRILGGWYIASQIDSFARGWRGDAEKSDQQAVWMRSIATHVSQPRQLADVVQYIESLAPAPVP